MLFLSKLILIVSFVFSNYVFSSVYSNTNNVNIGHVNGVVNNGSLLIKTNINSSSIFYLLNNGDYNGLNALRLENTELLDKSNGSIIIRSTHTQDNGIQLKFTVKIDTIIDSLKVNLEHEISGKDIIIYLPTSYNSVDLRVVQPVELLLPAGFRGGLNVNVSIDGLKLK